MACLHRFGWPGPDGNLFPSDYSREKPRESHQSTVAAGKGVYPCLAAIAAGLTSFGRHRMPDLLRSRIHGTWRCVVAKEDKIAKRPEIPP